jgi:hypothetical protein
VVGQAVGIGKGMGTVASQALCHTTPPDSLKTEGADGMTGVDAFMAGAG